FFLGRDYDLEQREVGSTDILYDAKDLTTHAVIVGMTGSGKTGLGISLLEEAAIDGIPALIIDPKGDMGNLLLNFPNLTANDFLPWVEKEEATRKGMTVDEFAASQAALWKKGLASWNQPQDRLQRLRDAADVCIYTPGSNAGMPLAILRSFAAPAPEVMQDSDALRERISSAVSGLLTLLRLDADPLRSREHVFLSNILNTAWGAGRSLDLAGMIREIQTPPFTKIGIMDLETIFPADERMKLAMTINNIIASPGFAVWSQGEPLNIQRLLYTPEGKPRLTVLSISHLNDAERMFFVTTLLNEVLSWMRSQPGTSSLRALLYMDEVFGYLPPTANPPSKTPMLTLLKQARAFGLGLVLATQNPVDLDYKALSNAGTWFLGRLQTERDKLRVLDGLEGASASAGAQFDRAKMEQILSGVGSRVFLLNNVHEDEPVVFHTRWALSYLRGPLTRDQITKLMAPRLAMLPPPPAVASAQRAADAAPAPQQQSAPAQADAVAQNTRPVLPPEIPQDFVAIGRGVSREASIEYRPALLATGKVHYTDTKSKADEWREVEYVYHVQGEVDKDPWDDAEALPLEALEYEDRPDDTASFRDIPSDLTKSRSYTSFGSSFKKFLYRHERLKLSFCPELKMYSAPNETEGDFKARLQHLAREERDLQIEKLRKTYASKFETLQERIRKAEQRVEVEKQQASSATMSAAWTMGTSVLGALFGRKTLSATNIGRAATSARAATRASAQRSDIKRAADNVDKLVEDKEELEKELEQKIDEIQNSMSVDSLTIEEYEITPRKSDISADEVVLLWFPYQIDDRGKASPAFE
ncbi:MAG: ATP-binding protein, partial [Planctomycetaceae bacterium]|nr:ATP-binding protein [Planctomycetaceae bacterium]